MIELLRSQDIVHLGFVTALLRDAGLHPVIFDAQMAMAEGSLPAIEQRLMIARDEADMARRVLEEAGISAADD